jgi:hypothetical protein
MLLFPSNAVTVKLNADPAVADAGAETAKCVAGGTVTAMELELPVIDGVTVSVAVRVWFPAVFKVAENVPTPFVKIEFAGKTAVPSLLVKCTVPAYAAALLLNGSSAVTVKLSAAPPVAVAGAETTKCVAAAALTAIVLDVPAIDAVTISVAVTVWLPAVFKVAENVPAPLVNTEFAGNTAAPSLLVKCTVPA